MSTEWRMGIAVNDLFHVQASLWASPRSLTTTDFLSFTTEVTLTSKYISDIREFVGRYHGTHKDGSTFFLRTGIHPNPNEEELEFLDDCESSEVPVCHCPQG